jgi:hypothetical protein
MLPKLCKIDDAIIIIRSLGKGAIMCKTDISDAFKQIPIAPSQWHLFCVKWRGNYYVCVRLPFGSRSSPKLFDTLSRAICWIEKHNYGIDVIVHLLDDFLTIDPHSACGERTMALLTLIFNRLKIPKAPSKTIGPCTVIEYLGIILYSEQMQARLPQNKVEHIVNCIKQFFHKGSVRKRELLQLLGHFNFATCVILPGRAFLSYLIRLSTKVRELDHYIHLDANCREELYMWHHFLVSWNGISVFLDNESTTAADLELCTDTSSKVGYGGYFKTYWFAAAWSDDLQMLFSVEDDFSMAFRELYPIVVAAVMI